MTLRLRCIQSNQPSIMVYLIVVHNCGRRSGGHHGEGVKDEIRRVDLRGAGWRI